MKVSVVVPVYNTSKFLDKCLSSLCNQTLRDIEIICVDDESTDNSLDILREFQKQDNRIQIYHHKNTGLGAAGARNVGLKAASGEYVIFLDSDDYFDSTLLEKTYHRAVETDADLVMFDAQEFDSESGEFVDICKFLDYRYLPKQEVFSWKEFPDYVFQVTIGAAWVLLIRNQCIQESGLMFQEIYHADDFFFTYSTLVYAKKVTIIREKLVYYRVNNSSSQTQNRIKSPLSAVKACAKLMDWLIEHGLFEIFRKSFINKATEYCIWYLDGMSDFNTFSQLYNELKYHAIDKLQLLNIKEEDVYLPYFYKKCKEIQQFSLEENLYLQSRPKTKFCYGSDYIFPTEQITKTDKVVLYGAGNVGKSYYIQNIVNNYCEIVSWVDKNYQQLGMPVMNPETIKEIEYDKVIVAIENRTVYAKIKEFLNRCNVSDEKIVWDVKLGG